MLSTDLWDNINKMLPLSLFTALTEVYFTVLSMFSNVLHYKLWIKSASCDF